MILNFLFWLSGMVFGGMVASFLFMGELGHLEKNCKQEGVLNEEDKGRN